MSSFLFRVYKQIFFNCFNDKQGRRQGVVGASNARGRENQETGETVTLIVSPNFVLGKTLLRSKNCHVPLVLLEVEGQ